MNDETDKKRVAVRQELAAWQAGYEAGKAGQPSTPPSRADGFSWSSGYIEGQAARQSSDFPEYIERRQAGDFGAQQPN